MRDDADLPTWPEARRSAPPIWPLPPEDPIWWQRWLAAGQGAWRVCARIVTPLAAYRTASRGRLAQWPHPAPHARHRPVFSAARPAGRRALAAAGVALPLLRARRMDARAALPRLRRWLAGALEALAAARDALAAARDALAAARDALAAARDALAAGIAVVLPVLRARLVGARAWASVASGRVAAARAALLPVRTWPTIARGTLSGVLSALRQRLGALRGSIPPAGAWPVIRRALLMRLRLSGSVARAALAPHLASFRPVWQRPTAITLRLARVVNAASMVASASARLRAAALLALLLVAGALSLWRGAWPGGAPARAIGPVETSAAADRLGAPHASAPVAVTTAPTTPTIAVTHITWLPAAIAAPIAALLPPSHAAWPLPLLTPPHKHHDHKRHDD